MIVYLTSFTTFKSVIFLDGCTLDNWSEHGNKI